MDWLIRIPLLLVSISFGAFCGTTYGSPNEDEKPAEPSSPSAWYGEAVRSSAIQSPQAELAGFHVPEGFKVELVASEPQITKPMNIAFDWKGRLWVTQTIEYPYPAKDSSSARDQIRILEDTDGDGNFEKVSVFAEGLNIPIGLLPYADGCLCFSIPNILFLRDKDGDGRSDESRIVLGPFDTTRDTHGMVNSLTMGLDGWVYANHGYNNQSKVQGSDGHSVSMTSGNTFRFRPDGSRVESYTMGQVNPFGSCQDAWGIRYTADCHSVPITQLLEGGCYPSFGRADDGLGFAPSMMEHLHGSTAIAGLAIGEGSAFPSNFQSNFFSGNVMTSRINRNRLVRTGSTVRAIELPDLLTSDDPCFRPVDLRFGPDGALYFADFYNRVIGHYEVPLDHPARDRQSGRIFRIRYVGKESNPSKESEPKRITPNSSLESLVTFLSSNRPWLRDSALERIVAGANPSQAISLLQSQIANSKLPAIGRAYAAWGLYQLQAKGPDSWTKLWESSDPLLKNHLALIAGKANIHLDLTPMRKALATPSSSNEENIARRAIVEAIGLHGNGDDIPVLLQLQRDSIPSDPVLAQACKIATRRLLRDPNTRTQLLKSWTAARKDSTSKIEPSIKTSISMVDPNAELLVTILLGLGEEIPYEPLFAWLSSRSSDTAIVRELLPKIATAVPLQNTELLLKMIESMQSLSSEGNADLLMKIAASQSQRYGRYAEDLEAASRKLAERWIQQSEKEQVEKLGSETQKEFPLLTWFEQGTRTYRPWPTQLRSVANEPGKETFFSSFGNTEEYVGRWTTAPFDAPSSLSFLVAGHNGLPSKPSHNKNRVQLIDSRSKEILFEAFPPRSDIATKVEWNLERLNGKKVQLQCIDDDASTAYAWIAIGRISQPGLTPTALRASLEQWIALGKSIPFDKQPVGLEKWLNPNRLDVSLRWRLLAAIARKNRPLAAQMLEQGAQWGWADPSKIGDATIRDLSTQVEAWPTTLDSALVQHAASLATTSQQTELVKLLASRRDWQLLLASLLDQGKLGSDTLIVLGEPWWSTLAEDEIGNRLRKWKPSDAGQVQKRLKATEFRISSLNSVKTDTARGGAVFKERCSLCHQLSGVGKVLGPQLEGVGGRGLQRLAEDILLPNRNVDEAFRVSTLLFDDGQIKTGWIRQRTEETLIVADQKGELTTYARKEIEKEQISHQSLMPDNFSEILSDDELASLIAYLQSQAKPLGEMPK